MTAFLYPITVPACRKYMFHMIIMVRRRDTNQRINALFYIIKIIKKWGYTPKQPPHFVKVKIFQGRFVVFLPSCEIWSDCNTSNHAPSCGLRLPFSSSRPILPFRRLLFVSALSVMRPHKKSVYTKKNAKIVCYLVTNGWKACQSWLSW